MNRLTRQEQLVLIVVLGLLIMGWAVKAYRTAHPPATAPATPTNQIDDAAAQAETEH